MIIAMRTPSEFEVRSDSGATYTIRYAGSGDADPDYVSLWECSCPGYRHRGDCKHMRAFLASDLTDADLPDYDGPTEIEC